MVDSGDAQQRGQVGRHPRSRGARAGLGQLVAEPEHVGAAGAGRHEALQALVVQERADPVAAAGQQPGQGDGELGQHDVLAPFAGAELHRAASGRAAATP